MRKKRRLLLAVLLMSVMLGGCAKAQPELPIATGEPAAEEAISPSMQLLESHREVMGNAKEASIYVEGKEATVPSDVLMELLSYSQWREIESSEAGASVIVAVQEDELSVYENGTVRLGRGNESGWYQVPLEVVMDLKETFEINRIPTDEDFIFDEEWMWNNYFYETITSIGNAKHFDAEDLTEIDEIIEYVWYRYSLSFSSADEMGFEFSPEISSYYLFPREIAYQEAGKYFAFDISNADLNEAYSYLAEYDAFQMHYVGPREEGEVSGNNPWAIYYGGVEPLEENRYLVRMLSYVDKEAGIVDRENIYTIRLSDAGTFLFESGEIRMPYYPLSDFSQSLMPLDAWKGIIGEYTRMIGESEEEIFFYQYEDGAKIIRVQKADLNQVKTLALKWDDQETLVQMHASADGKHILVCTSHYVRKYNNHWEEEQVVPLPAFLIEKILSETIWDDFAPSSIFTGYDVTDDLTRIVYGDEEGLKLFEIDEKSEVQLMEKSEAYPEDDLSPVSVYQAPRFVDRGQKIFVVRSGYEGNRGIALYDLKTETMERYGHGWSIWTNEMRPNQGAFILNEYVHNWDTGEGTVQHFFLDFASGEVQSFVFDRMGGDDMPDGGEFYHGENKLAMLVKAYNEEFMGGYATYVQEIDFESMELLRETKIRAARIRIMGMDREGNIYLHYYYNQDSQGFGVLPAAEES